MITHVDQGWGRKKINKKWFSTEFFSPIKNRALLGAHILSTWNQKMSFSISSTGIYLKYKYA
jgi:hypothetical protein